MTQGEIASTAAATSSDRAPASRKKTRGGLYGGAVKRILDILLAGSALIVLSPLLAVLALLVRINLGAPVLFRQVRPGRIDPKTGRERFFVLLKFRTMRSLSDKSGKPLPDPMRRTRFGDALRRHSLDELPELWNVLRGDMALVGPRPQLVRDMVFMTAGERRRHTVRPGLTGLAQIHGRNALSWEEKFRWDRIYLRRLSLFTDCGILLRTVFTVLRGDGAEARLVPDYGDCLLREKRISPAEYLQKQEEARLLTEAFEAERAKPRRRLPARLYERIRGKPAPYYWNYSLPLILWKPLRKWLANCVAASCPFNCVRIALYRLCGFRIGRGVFIGMRCYLDDMCPELFSAEDGAVISYGVYFACHGRGQKHLPITVGRNAYIGMGAAILSRNADGGEGGVTIGEGAVVGARAVVNRNIPPYRTAVGVPCRLLPEKPGPAGEKEAEA